MRTLLLLLPLLVAAPLAAQVPDTDVWVASLTRRGDSLAVTTPRNLTSRPGYDNQPAWVGGEALLYVSRRDGQTDVWRVEVGGGALRQLTRTAESEYSPTLTPDGRGIAVVRVERDSTQRLWRFPLSGAGAPRLLLPAVRPVGYFAWSGPSTLALFVLGSPNSLQVARLGDASANTVASGIGRSLQPVPGTPAVSFIHHDGGTATVKRLDPASGDVRPLFAALPESDDLAWVDSATALMARGARVYASRGGDWREVADLAAAGVGRITRLAVSPDRRRLAFVAETAAPARAGARAEDVRRLVHALAADSMEGRRTATPGIARAERLIAEEFRRIGLRAGGDDGGYLQRVPLTAVERNGRPGLALLPSLAALDTVPRERRREGANVVGVISGGDPSLRDEVVVVGAHHDHIGVRGPAVNGDSLNNGADDDASGVVAVIEIARALAAGPPPKRTVVFVTFTGEEMGLLGTRWYLAHPAFPLERTVAQLQIEMIGRPDSLAGGAGKGWLTGYERSTMGDMLKRSGVPIVPDPRPAQNFFERSDNIAFARLGIPAHTLSSFGMHTDYHRPTDEAGLVDVPHMTQVIDAAITATRLLADGAKPEWHPGGRPAARTRR